MKAKENNRRTVARRETDRLLAAHHAIMEKLPSLTSAEEAAFALDLAIILSRAFLDVEAKAKGWPLCHSSGQRKNRLDCASPW
jgi:hypothetical protein